MIHVRRILARRLAKQLSDTIKVLVQGKINLAINTMENEEEFDKWYKDVIDKPTKED